MTAPAYHLRHNKAADRFALMEAIRRLARLSGNDLRKYTYYGFGGPYLEDFRLLYELYPEIRMVSIEQDKTVWGRQKFHSPCSSLEFADEDMSSFITGYNPGNAKSIFWLDYMGLEYGCFTDFQSLLGAVAYGSMIKVTLRSMPSDFRIPGNSKLNDLGEQFPETFRRFMPNGFAGLPNIAKDFAVLLQRMIQIAAQKALSAVTEGGKFIPVSSFYYHDGTWMFTLTGVVCGEDEVSELEKTFNDWKLANLKWGPPTLIKVPVLSTKERLRLQPWLPAQASAKTLHKKLGHLIDTSCEKTEKALERYADFHRYTPYFLRGVP